LVATRRRDDRVDLDRSPREIIAAELHFERAGGEILFEDFPIGATLDDAMVRGQDEAIGDERPRATDATANDVNNRFVRHRNRQRRAQAPWPVLFDARTGRGWFRLRLDVATAPTYLEGGQNQSHA
jgi:hypothetical protein